MSIKIEKLDRYKKITQKLEKLLFFFLFLNHKKHHLCEHFRLNNYIPDFAYPQDAQGCQR